MKGAQILQQVCCKSKLCLQRNSPTILSCIGSAGVVATAALAVKVTPKAVRLLEKAVSEKGENLTVFETIQIAGPSYIPAALVGLSTIACIFGANVLNKRQQAAITSAYMLLENTYKEYQKKVKEMLGDHSDALIKRSIVKDKSREIDISPPEEQLFYEFNHGEFFERTKEDVLNAEYRFNLLFRSKGYASLNDFYDLLGLEQTEYGESLGWTYGDGYSGHPWVEFEHEPLELEDGMQCYIINMPIQPTINYANY